MEGRLKVSRRGLFMHTVYHNHSLGQYTLGLERPSCGFQPDQANIGERVWSVALLLAIQILVGAPRP
jgi:hypothetical protein